MRVVFLNTWLGKAEKPLLEFIKDNASGTDIFSFQEVEPPLNKKISAMLKNFLNFENHKVFGVNDRYQLSTFVNQKHKVKNKKLDVIKGEKIGDCLIVELDKLIVCNVHGVAFPGDKLDTDKRIRQSQLILKAVKKYDKPKVIGGDFNLLPNTESIVMFEKSGFRNLIKDFKIKSTRNNFAVEQAKSRVSEGLPFFGIQPFADFCFVSKDVKVNSFKVPYEEISDHLPLVLDFEF